MNSSGLNLIKTLGCLTAVTFFTLYNTYDNYSYNYNQALAFLTFISTIATPLFFVVAGYLDAGSQHSPEWQLKKIRRIVVIFLFWYSIYYFIEPFYKGYLIQPWFALALVIIYCFHPLIDWLIKRRVLCLSLLGLLLLVALGYDLQAVSPSEHRWLSIPAEFRLWTWLLYYLTGQLLLVPAIAAFYTRPRVAKAALIAVPFVYVFTWLYEKHFFFALFRVERDGYILTGSQVYILVVLIIIAINGLNISESLNRISATLSKTMTGVYILHYSFFNLLIQWISITSLASKLFTILLTFLLSVMLTLLMLQFKVTKRLVSF